MLALKHLFFKRLYEREIFNILSSAEANYVKIDKAILNKTITLRWLVYNRYFVSKSIIKDLKQKEFKSPIAIERTVSLEKKDRTMYFFDWHIRVLHGVLAYIFTKKLEEILPNEIASYRKGRNIYETVKETAQYIEKYKKDNPNALIEKSIIRKDVKSYGDSINLNILCNIIKKYLPMDNDLYQLICLHLKFKYISENDGKIYTKKIGLPTGSPLNTVFTNLYLIELDKALVKENIFYRRYGDDLIIVGNRLDIINTKIEFYRKKLNLIFNEKKEGWIDIKSGFFKQFSDKMVIYLGFMLDFNSYIYPTIEKDLKIKSYIISTVQVAYLSMRKDIKNKDVQVQILIDAVKVSLYKTELYSYLSQIIGTVSDIYLKELDTWVATIILKFIFHKSSDKVFIAYSFKKLREKGLPSLRHFQTLRLYRRSAIKEYMKIIKEDI